MDDSNESKKPEFIYVDEPYTSGDSESLGQQDYWSAIGQLQQSHFPVGLRILALLAGLFMGVVAGMMLLLMVFWLTISLLTGRQVENINKQATRAVKLAAKCSVLCLGLFVAVFYPPLGIGFIILYFVFTGQEMNEAMFKRFSFHSPHQN